MIVELVGDVTCRFHRFLFSFFSFFSPYLFWKVPHGVTHHVPLSLDAERRDAQPALVGRKYKTERNSVPVRYNGIV